MSTKKKLDTATLEALYRAYVQARVADPEKPISRPDLLLRHGEKCIFPYFGSRPWRTISQAEIRAWHAGIKEPRKANLALDALRAAIYWGIEQRSPNPCAGIRPREVCELLPTW